MATLVYDRLTGENSSARDSLMISSMLLRAAAIAQHGPVSGHPVLDLQQIVRWFCDGLTISPHRAASKARHWRSCNIGEIRELRSIKNRLAAIAVLADSDKCVLPSEIKAWLSLREKLP